MLFLEFFSQKKLPVQASGSTEASLKYPSGHLE